MATMVKVKKTGQVTILLGAGFEMYESSKPSAFFGDWVAGKKVAKLPWLPFVTIRAEWAGFLLPM